MQRVARVCLLILEFSILSALILATRCANYQDVFVAGNVYFTDADCYARMTRVRMCEKKPGLIVRHHDFENFPEGTTPHTTAPLDYLILALAAALKPFTAHGIDLAGALISPLLALVGGWFLWWWSRRMNLRYRWIMLVLRSRIFSGTASPDWLDFICRYFGGCVCHRATASAIATILFRPNLWKLVAHYRRVSPSFAAASDLVSVGRLAVDRYTNPYLVCISSQKSSPSLRHCFACG